MFKRILIAVVLVALLAGVAYAIFSSKAAEPTAPAVQTPTPKPTTPTDGGNIISDAKKPAPGPKTHEYVYNVLEFYISDDIGDPEILARQLRGIGYDVSKKQIIMLQEEHRIKDGDTVMVRGKVIDYRDYGDQHNGAVMIFQGIGNEKTTLYPTLHVYVDWIPGNPDPVTGLRKHSKPQWLADIVKKIEAGEEVVVTIRGTVKKFRTIIANAELVE